MSDQHWGSNNEQHLKIDFNFYHQMSIKNFFFWIRELFFFQSVLAHYTYSPFNQETFAKGKYPLTKEPL
jgi:hypothetical protein